MWPKLETGGNPADRRSRLSCIENKMNQIRPWDLDADPIDLFKEQARRRGCDAHAAHALAVLLFKIGFTVDHF